METFAGALLGVLGALLVELLLRHVHERDQRKREQQRHAHLLRLVVTELRSDMEVVSLLSRQIQTLEHPTTAVRTSVWGAFFDEIFQALPYGSTVDSVAAAYESLISLDRLVDSYERQLSMEQLEQAATTARHLRSSLGEASHAVQDALVALGEDKSGTR